MKRLSEKLIDNYEEDWGGMDMFRFDSDEAIFCIYSGYVDDLMRFAKDYLKVICNDEKKMIDYLS